MHSVSLRQRAGIFIAAFLYAGMSFSSAATPGVQAYEDLKAMFDQAQYQKLLPQLNRTLADKPSIAKPEDHYALLVLKGDAMLQMKVADSAIEAFRAASLAGADDASTAVAKATVTLIRKSSGFKYQPKAKSDDKTAAQPPISILAPDDRKQAFAALFIDLLAVDQPVVTSAEKSSSLPTITNAASQLADLRNVEIESTGADSQSKELLQKLGTRASDLMTAALKPMSVQITTIEKAAARTRAGIRRNGNVLTQFDSTVGLSPQNEEKLDSLVDQAREISSAAVAMEPVFKDAGDFKTIETDADKIVKDADALLTRYKMPTE